ncbi:MAG: methyltransferase [Rhodobacter sp.]|nr:methyltransferase [Rhodobacter sp.]
MSDTRLNIALGSGAVTLPPEGRIAVFRPHGDADLSDLPGDRVHVIQGFRPDHDAFVASGYDTGVAPDGAYSGALVFLTRSKIEARALIAQAAGFGGVVIVDGQKTDGIESILRDIRKRADVGEVISKAHGKLFAFRGGDFSDWQPDPAGHAIAGGFRTVPGVFSADGIDPGSAVLAAALPARLSGRIADLGAGWGFLAREILTREGVSQLHLIEAEHAALACARVNVTDARAQFHWADALQFAPDVPLDAVVSNPPFHTSRAAEPAIGRAFIAAAARMLKPSGKLWLVANRHLPYEAEAALHFLDVQEVAGDKRFKILAAAKPRRGRH